VVAYVKRLMDPDFDPEVVLEPLVDPQEDLRRAALVYPLGGTRQLCQGC